jgi:isopentenyldiphosphate isomerase
MSEAIANVDIEEVIDLCDEHGVPLGTTRLKRDAHRDGDWHRASHLWILTPAGGVLLQLRASVKENFPNLWDVSVAGHVSAGESPLDAAIREAREEIGLALAASELRHIGTLHQQVVLHGGAYVDNVLHDVFVAVRDVDLTSLVLQREEVADVRIVSVDELREMLAKSPSACVPHPGEYELLFAEIAALA